MFCTICLSNLKSHLSEGDIKKWKSERTRDRSGVNTCWFQVNFFISAATAVVFVVIDVGGAFCKWCCCCGFFHFVC